jgi:hypothetical protein
LNTCNQCITKTRKHLGIAGQADGKNCEQCSTLGRQGALLLKKPHYFSFKNNQLKNLLIFLQCAVPVFARSIVLANVTTQNGEKSMSNTHRRNPGSHPSRLSQAIRGILLASALTASVAAHCRRNCPQEKLPHQRRFLGGWH